MSRQLVLRNGLLSHLVPQEKSNQHLFFDCHVLRVAEQWQNVLAVVIQVVLPGIFLNVHHFFVRVRLVGLVNRLAKRLKRLNRRQQKLADPLTLVRVNLPWLYGQNRL